MALLGRNYHVLYLITFVEYIRRWHLFHRTNGITDAEERISRRFSFVFGSFRSWGDHSNATVISHFNICCPSGKAYFMFVQKHLFHQADTRCQSRLSTHRTIVAHIDSEVMLKRSEIPLILAIYFNVLRKHVAVTMCSYINQTYTPLLRRVPGIN